MRKLIKENKKVLLSIVGLIILLFYLFPAIWMVSSSFKSLSETLSFPPTIIPNNIQVDSFIRVINSGVLRFMFNSLVIATATTTLTVIFGALAGYSLSRVKSKWVNWILLIFLIAQMLPEVLMVTPLFIIFSDMGIMNTTLAVILGKTAVSLPLAVIMLRTTFLAMPRSLEEAAWIDGCTRIGAVFKILFPMAKTGILVIAAMTFMFSYGDFIFSLSFLNDLSRQTVTVGLYTFIGADVTRWNNVMAFATIISLPLIAMFIALQSKIIQGMTDGAFK